MRFPCVVSTKKPDDVSIRDEHAENARSLVAVIVDEIGTLRAWPLASVRTRGGTISEIWILLGLVALNGVLAGAEIAVVTLRPARVRALVAEKRVGAAAIARLQEAPERFLATVQIGMTVIGSTAGAFSGQMLVGRVVPILARWPLVGAYASELAFGLVVGFLSYVSLVIGELVPKSLALRKNEIYALWMARPLDVLARIARPLVWVLTSTSNAILRFFGDRTSFIETRISRDEVHQILNEATQVGELDPRISDIAARALNFGDLSAGDVMIPRHQIVALDISCSLPLTHERISSTPHSRFPVYAHSIDNIVGYIAAKDALSFRPDGEFRVSEIMRKVPFVPETMRAVDVLHDLQRGRTHLAIVVDERGGTAGLLTTEDLVEELVGELFAEGEAPHVPPIRKVGDDSYLVSGATPVRELNRELNLELPIGEQWSTVAGLFLSLAGHLPQRGEMLQLESGVRLEAVEVSSRRIQVLRVCHAGQKEMEALPASISNDALAPPAPPASQI